MKKFIDFIKKKPKTTTEQEDIERRKKHLGWGDGDIEIEKGSDKQPIKEDSYSSRTGLGLSGGSIKSGNYGGIKHPLSTYNQKHKEKWDKQGDPGKSLPFNRDHPEYKYQRKLDFAPGAGTHTDPQKIQFHADVYQHHEKHEADDMFRPHHSTLTDSQLSVSRIYKEDSHDYFNNQLRKTKGKLTKPFTRYPDENPKSKYVVERNKKFRQNVSHMDKVTSGRTTEHLTVYRGIHNPKLAHLPVGTKFTDHGYTGTSLNPGTAQSFSGGHYHIFRIHVPKGSKAHFIDMQPHSYAHEQEVLLHRGTKFQVHKHSIDEHGRKVVDLHVVGQHGGTKK